MSENLRELTLTGLPSLPQTETLKRVATTLWKRGDVVALWLSGSFAREKTDKYSDIDLRVAIHPEAQEQWQEPGLFDLLGEVIAGAYSFGWDQTRCHQLLLESGLILDLIVQSADQDPPQDATRVLGCRDAAFGQRLAEAKLPPIKEAEPADPAAILAAVTQFWIGSQKHVKMLHRELDLLILIGLGLEQPVLIRLWYVDATGRDQGTSRETIHTLTPTVRAVTASLGARSLETLGLPRTNRAQIRQAIEANRDEVAAVGRRLASKLGFEYPEALEQTVRETWRQYLIGLTREDK